MIDTMRKKKRLAAWLAAASCGLWLLAQAVPAEAQASRTRPGGSSGGSASSSSGSSGGGSTSSSRGSSPSRPASVQRTRPPGGSSGGSPTVIDRRRPSSSSGGFGSFHHSHYGFYPSWWYSWSPYRWSWWLSWSWWYPSWGYPGWGYPYYGYGYYPPYGATVYERQVRPSMGALDTDVWPARTQIWINGQYVGFVDQFDGFPRYLWLEKGTYDVAFYLDGYKTLARQYTVYPGLVIDVEDRLERGESVHPSELTPAQTPRRDARIDADREQRARADEPDWRSRVRADREAVPGPEAEGDDQGRALDLRGEGARLYLGIVPDDAAVYLDGRFIGTGSELSGGADGVLIDPGSHELSVVRPGYGSRRIEFDAEAGGEVELEVKLEEAA